MKKKYESLRSHIEEVSNINSKNLDLPLKGISSVKKNLSTQKQI